MSTVNKPSFDPISLVVDLLFTATAALADKAKRNETILRVLNELGLQPEAPPADFEGCYVYALVKFGQLGSKPKPVLEFFRHPTIRQCFRRAYINRETVSLADILDWHRISDEIKDAKVDLKAELDEFTAIFDDYARRASSPGELANARDITEIKRMLQVKSADQGFIPHVQLPSPDPPKTVSLEEQAYFSQIEQARGQRDHGNPNAGKSILESLAKALENAAVSDNLRFKLETNLGACELDLGNYQEASQLFESAVVHAPNNPKAIANLALAKLLRGDYQAALDLAKQVLEKGGDSEQTSAPAIYVQALIQVDATKSPEEAMNGSYLNNADYLRVMGSIFLQRENYLKAEEMFRRALVINENDDTSLVLLAQVTLLSKSAPMENQVFISPQEADNLSEGLAEAEDLIGKAVALLQKGDNRGRLHDALASRAGIRAARGEMEAAIRDCERVLSEDARHLMALHNRGLIAHQQGSFGLAIQYFTSIPESDWEKLNVFLPLAHTYVETGESEHALEVLRKIPDGYDAAHFVEVFVIRSQAFLQQKAYQLVEEQISSRLTEYPNHPVLLEAVAFIEYLQQHNHEALTYLLEAYKHVSSKDKERIALRIATHYFDTQQYEEAVRYYEQLEALLSSDSLPARQYLVSLYKVRQYARAYQVAQQLRARGSTQPTVIEITAWINEQTGNLKAASELYSQLATLQPDKPEFLVAQARTEFRRGNSEVALAILRSLHHASVENPVALMEIAEMLAFSGEKVGALPLAYRARQLGFNRPEIHLAYVQVFHNCSLSNPEAFEVNEVGENIAVLVREGQDTRRWLTILKVPPIDRARNEFSIDDPLAQTLIGHRKGNVVQVKKGPLEEIIYTIEEIQSIYVRAYQETFDNFGMWFPDHNGIAKIRFEIGDPTRLLTIVAGQSVQLEQLYRLYDQQHITFSQFAALAGKNEVALWGGLAGQPGRRLIASFGTREEQKHHQSRIEEAKQITIDLTALLTSAYLNTLIYLPQKFCKIYLPQIILDTLGLHIIGLQTIGGAGFKNVSFENGRFVWNEVSRENIEKHIQHVEKLREFILAHCEIVPLFPGAIPLFEEGEQGFLADQNSTATMLVARQTNSLLYSDDLRLRLIAEKSFGVLGFWTQALLASLAATNQISEEDYFENSIQLIRAHYYFAAVNPKLLIYTFKKNNLHITAEVEDVLTTLHGPRTSENDAIRVIAECLRELWLQTWLVEQKVFVLDQCLRTLIVKRTAPVVLQKLNHYLGKRLQLAPLHHDEILSQIDIWRRTNNQ